MRFRRAWAVAGAVAVLSVPAAAQAQTNLTSTTTGAYSYNWGDSNIKAADTKADNHSVYAEFTFKCIYEGESIVMRLENHNGAGSSTSAGPYYNCPFVKHRAGVDRLLQTDLLGPWVYPK